MVCTIHQPSSDICSLFDDAMLLSGGRQPARTLQAHHLHMSNRSATILSAHQDAGKDFVHALKGCLLCTGGQMLYNGTWEAAETYMAVAGYG